MQRSVDLAPEVMVGGRYRLIAPLDSGATASVWRALDVQLDREVALKIIRDQGVDPELRSRAEREARVLASLSHPNIVRVLDGGDDEGSPYIVMELLEGESLNRMIAKGERLSVDEAVNLVADVADGLGSAHARGVIHRDVKPGNIVCRGSVATLVDFGVARNIDATTLTRGLVVGTASYLAPEQAQGRPLQPSADVYSLACVLYELLVGRPPFTGDTSVAIAMKHVNETPVPPSDLVELPPAVNDLVVRCLSKDPDRRPTDGLAMAGALRDALVSPHAETVAITPLPIDGTQVMPAVAASPPPIDPPPIDPPPVARRPSARPRWGLAAAVIVMLILGGVLLTAAGNRDTRPVPDVTNASVSDATTYLEGAGLHVKVTDVASRAPAGTVVGTDPAPGETIGNGGTVELQVSSGSDSSATPTTTTAPTVQVQLGGHGKHPKRDG